MIKRDLIYYRKLLLHIYVYVHMGQAHEPVPRVSEYRLIMYSD